MGESSESCALSGLEITKGSEAVLLSVFPEPEEISGHALMETPMRGTYSGYGTLDLETGEEVTPEESHLRQPVWVLAAVLDGLGDIPQPEAGMTAAEFYADHERRIRAVLDTDPEGPIIDMSDLVGDTCRISTPDFRKAVRLGNSLHGGVDYMTWFDLFHARRESPESLERVLAEYRTGWMIKNAEAALRKRITPGIVGAQNGGDKATIAFARLTLAIAEARLETRPSPEHH